MAQVCQAGFLTYYSFPVCYIIFCFILGFVKVLNICFAMFRTDHWNKIFRDYAYLYSVFEL